MQRKRAFFHPPRAFYSSAIPPRLPLLILPPLNLSCMLDGGFGGAGGLFVTITDAWHDYRAKRAAAEAAEAAAKLGAPALVDHALRRFAKRASVERWGAHAKAALAGPGAAPLGAAPPAGLNIGPPVVAQSVPPAWTPGAFP